MTSSRDSISEPLAAPCWILSSVPRKPNHMAVYKNNQGERYTLATMYADLKMTENKLSEAEGDGNTVIPFSAYWKDITVTRWNIHKREWSAAIQDTLNAGRWTRRLFDRVLA